MEAKAQGGLEAGALGLGESVVMGVAGTAPAFSLAATTATLIATVHTLAPASLLYCGLIMFGVTLAYRQLNRLQPDAGACYAWVGTAFHPVLGFLAGWALLVASAVFMVSGTIPAATATLLLLDPALAARPALVTLVAAGWLLLVSAVVIKGIKLTSYTQVAMTVVELAVLVAVSVAALAHATRHAPHALALSSLSALSPWHFTPHLFANGALVALFFFWGWDVTANLTEETRDPSRVPGRGALLAMGIVLALFIAFVAACLLVLSDTEIRQAGTNVVFALASRLFPRPWDYLAVLAVMLSTVGTLETSILQFSRTLYASGRDGLLHGRYARLHPVWRTPWVATLVISGCGLLLLLAAATFDSVGEIIQDSVNAISFQVAFYYGLVGFACAWRSYRAAAGTADLALMVAWPAASATFLWAVALYSMPAFDFTARVIAVGGITIGVVPLLLGRRRRRLARTAAGDERQRDAADTG
ncbi:amino acid permease [Cupriavidus sp. USMAA2-4]|uniref:APC family permease n=1 Tax=Cupriavidus sp. USMAA2-4 TaxID=876364 RepID=UPI0008A6700D|nr:APC family permease [Cupriavidus sp. USMAA2-4]AOY96004.1 amino acid permease [Cupriavidus sp. USMAA2-4]